MLSSAPGAPMENLNNENAWMECRALGTGITSLSWPYINGRNPLLLNSRVATEERLRGY